MYQGLTYLDLGKIEEAEKATEQAIKDYKHLGIIYYQNAQYNALLKNKRKSFDRLREAADFSVGFAIKADSDPLFDNVRADVNLFLSMLTRSINRKISKEIRPVKIYIRKGNMVFSQLKDPDLTVINPEEKIMILIKRKKLIDSLVAARLLEAISVADPIFSESQRKIENLISEAKTKRNNLFLEKKQKREEKQSIIASGFIIISILILLFLSIDPLVESLSKSIFYIVFWVFGGLIFSWVLFWVIGLPVYFISGMILQIFYRIKSEEQRENDIKIDFLEKISMEIKKIEVPKASSVDIQGITKNEESCEIDDVDLVEYLENI